MNHEGVTYNITNFDLKPGFEIKKIKNCKLYIFYISLILILVAGQLELYIAK